MKILDEKVPFTISCHENINEKEGGLVSCAVDDSAPPPLNTLTFSIGPGENSLCICMYYYM